MNTKIIPILSLFAATLLAWNNGLAAEDKEVLAVTTQPLSSLLIRPVHSAPASVVGLNHTTISSQISGLGLKINAETGQTVKKGDLLVEIDCRDYDIAYQQATAALNATNVNIAHTKKQFMRNQRLYKSRTIPQEMLEQTETAHLSAKATIEPQRYAQKAAKLAQTRCKVYAPFTGQITQRLVQQGQLLSPGTPLFQLLETGNIEIRAELSASELNDAKQATGLDFVTADKSYDVTIRAVLQQVNPSARTQEVRFKLANKTILAINLSGRLQWQDQTGQLSPEYIMRRNGSLGVMIIKDDKAHFHPLPHAIEGQPVQAFLSSSTQVIAKNRFRVTEGETVTIDNSELVN